MTHGGIWFRPFVGHVPLWVTSHCGSRPTVGYVPPWVRPAVGLCHRESRPRTVPPWVTSRRGSRHAVVDSDVPPWVASSCVSDCVTSAVGPSPRGCVPPWVTSRHCPARGSRLAMAHVPSWVRSRSGSYPTVFSFRRGSVPPPVTSPRRSRPAVRHVEASAQDAVFLGQIRHFESAGGEFTTEGRSELRGLTILTARSARRARRARA